MSYSPGSDLRRRDSMSAGRKTTRPDYVLVWIGDVGFPDLKVNFRGPM